MNNTMALHVVSPFFEMFVVIILGAGVIVLAFIGGVYSRASRMQIDATWQVVDRLDKLAGVAHRLAADVTIHARLLGAARMRDGMYGPGANTDFTKAAMEAQNENQVHPNSSDPA